MSKREEREKKMVAIGEKLFKEVEIEWEKIVALMTVIQDYLSQIGELKGLELEKMSARIIVFHLLNEYYDNLEEFTNALEEIRQAKIKKDYNPEDLE